MSADNLAYHQTELADALANDSARNRPTLAPIDNVVLDLGCGIGQTFLAWDSPGRLYVGLDVDESAIRHAIEHDGNQFQFFLAGGESIPFPADTFDLVMRRVSPPHMNIPQALDKIARVLKPGGRICFTLHSREHAEKCIAEASGKGLRHFILSNHLRLNGYLLQWFGFLVPLAGRRESWHTPATIVRMLEQRGFVCEVDVGSPVIVTATIWQ